jgi:NAD(P)-dependent dehydrogenase (short-subunit alcohol dehydrogenase family)
MTNRRTIVVTGGLSGIGKAISENFVESGERVIALDLSKENNFSWGENFSVIECDVTEEKATIDAMNQVRNEIGLIDLLVINAGVVPRWQETAAVDIDDFERVIKVNVIGAMITLKSATPHLRSPGGKVVMTGSINSWKGDPNLASYVASKHGIAGLVKSAAMDLGRRGINVNAVAPGAIATEALTNRILERNGNDLERAQENFSRLASQTALGRIATIADVVGTVEFLASPTSDGITGQIINVDGGVL